MEKNDTDRNADVNLVTLTNTSQLFPFMPHEPTFQLTQLNSFPRAILMQNQNQLDLLRIFRRATEHGWILIAQLDRAVQLCGSICICYASHLFRFILFKLSPARYRYNKCLDNKQNNIII